MEIVGHEVEQLHDPTGILQGERYEFFLEFDVPEEDDLFSEHGLILRVIFAVTESEKRILNYEIIEKSSNKVLDFALEHEEEELILSYCIEHYK